MAEAESTNEIAQTSSENAPECIHFKTKEKIFTDEVVKKYEIPQYTIDESVTATQIVKAVNFVLKNAANPDASADVVKVICSIALNELRDPTEKRYYVHRVFDRAHLDEEWQQFLNEDYKRGYVILGAIETPEESNAEGGSNGSVEIGAGKAATTAQPTVPVKGKNLGDIKLADLERKYTTASGGGGGHEPAQEMWSPDVIGSDIYAPVYAGAWATYMLKAWVKKGEAMQELIGKCHEMIESIYVTFTEPIPKMSLQAYKNLHQIMRGKNPYITGVFIRAATYCYAIKHNTQAIMAMKGLVMNQVFDHALTTYSLCNQVCGALDRGFHAVLNNLSRENLTEQSCLDLMIFYYRYCIRKEYYDILGVEMKRSS